MGGSGVEAAGPRIVPRKPYGPAVRLLGDAGEEHLPQLPVQDPPQVGGIPVKAGQHQDVQGRQIIRQDGQGQPGKVDASHLHLLPDLFLGAVFPVVLDLHQHPAPGAFFHQLSKPLGTPGGGVAGRLVVGIGQDELRGHFSRLAAAARQTGGCAQRQKCAPLHLHRSPSVSQYTGNPRLRQCRPYRKNRHPKVTVFRLLCYAQLMQGP